MADRSRVTRFLSSRKAFWASASVALGVTGAVLVDLGYNYFRYQTILPKEYLTEASSTSPTVVKSMEFFTASALSPNGGIVIFWFAGFFVAGFQMRQYRYRFSPVALVLSLVLCLMSLAGFSLWWAPFGWDSWGNRLMLPSMLASLIVLIGTASTGHQQLVSTIPAKVLSFSIFALSTYFVVVSYYSDRGKLFAHALFSGADCRAMMAVLNDPGKPVHAGFLADGNLLRLRAREIPVLSSIDALTRRS